MLNPLKDVFDLAMQGCALFSDRKETVAEKTFQEVFSKIQETRADYEERSPHPRPGRKEDRIGAGQEQKPEPPSRAAEKSGGERVEEAPKAENKKQPETEASKADDASPKKDSGASQTEKEATARIAKEIEERMSRLKETDPELFNELLNNIDNLSLKDLLAALGLEQGRITAIGQFADMDAKLTDEMKTAIASGEPEDLLAGLKSLGLGEKDVKRLLAIINGNGDGKASSAAAENALPLPEGAATPKTADMPFTKGLENASAGKKDNLPLVNAASGAVKHAAPGNPAQPQHGAAVNMSVQQAAFRGGADAVQAASGESGQGLDYNVASGGDNGRAESAGGTQKPAEAARGAFERMLMSQVVEKVRINIRQNGASSISIKLDPPSLGKIDMRIMTHDNQVKAVMVAESREVKMIIERDIEGLKASLNNEGLKVDQITVTTAEDQSRFRNENLAREFGQNRGRGNARAVGGAGGVAEAEEGALTSARASYHDGILDVVA